MSMRLLGLGLFTVAAGGVVTGCFIGNPCSDVRNWNGSCDCDNSCKWDDPTNPCYHKKCKPNPSWGYVAPNAECAVSVDKLNLAIQVDPFPQPWIIGGTGELSRESPGACEPFEFKWTYHNRTREPLGTPASLGVPTPYIHLCQILNGEECDGASHKSMEAAWKPLDPCQTDDHIWGFSGELGEPYGLWPKGLTCPDHPEVSGTYKVWLEQFTTFYGPVYNIFNVGDNDLIEHLYCCVPEPK